MLFLVNCTVEKTHYMLKPQKYEQNHIVEAENESDACDKIETHYNRKRADVNFEVSHSVQINYTNEVIL